MRLSRDTVYSMIQIRLESNLEKQLGRQLVSHDPISVSLNGHDMSYE
jgi:hypothetical protein